jgi:ribonuclease HI
LLFSEARFADEPGAPRGRWRFVLESLDGAERLEAADDEPDAAAQRLDLLAVVRGLEALDQPSRVTLVTSSSYVSRGLRFGLAQWRENDWMWERFGKMTPVKDSDLWRRVDQALRFHQVECRTWRFDSEPAASVVGTAAPPATAPARSASPVRRQIVHGLAAMVDAVDRLLQTWRQYLTNGAGALSSPLTASGNLR